MTDPVRVLVSIDTEEDDWAKYELRGSPVENIELLPEFQSLWDRYGARPTYFVNYPPLESDRAASVLAELSRDTSCEMALHCHPWNTPPQEETEGRPETMMYRLSREENRQKLDTLARLYRERLQADPVSFRAGRWGFGPSVAGALMDLGVRVDSSVSPFVDWTSFGGPDFSGAPQRPYRFHPDRPLSPALDGPMVEVPTSVGYLRGNQALAASVRAWLEKSAVRHLKVVGVLDVTGMLARRWLSPEISTDREMIQLARALVSSGARILDLTFHSSSLLPGATPFVRSQREKEEFVARIEAFLEFCADEGFQFATVGQVGMELAGDRDRA